MKGKKLIELLLAIFSVMVLTLMFYGIFTANYPMAIFYLLWLIVLSN
jgi:hypothetical protein